MSFTLMRVCGFMTSPMELLSILLEIEKRQTFSISRNKKMFEEVIRRVRVLNDLLKEQKTPILEPSTECSECQYYERCFMKKKNTKQLDLVEMFRIWGQEKLVNK